MVVFGVRRGFKMLLCHIPPTSFNMSPYRAIWTHVRPTILDVWQNMFGSFRILGFGTFYKYHSHDFLAYLGRSISKSEYERTRFRIFSRIFLTCYKPSRSKTSAERGCNGFTLSPNISGSWISGFLDSRWISGFTMGSWIHDGFLSARWVPGFTMGS